MTFVPWTPGLYRTSMLDVPTLTAFLKHHKITISTSQTPFTESWLHLAGLWDLTHGELSPRWLGEFYLVADANDNMIVEEADMLSSFFQIMWMFKKTNVLEPWCEWWSGPEDLSEEKEGAGGANGAEDKGKKGKKRKKRAKLTMRKGKKVKKM
jgi:hypothetical protein